MHILDKTCHADDVIYSDDTICHVLNRVICVRANFPLE